MQNNNIQLPVHICKKCKIEFIYIGTNPQKVKYCDLCARTIKKRQQLQNPLNRLGTTQFNPRMSRKQDNSPDWSKELEQINKEYEYLHLKKKC